MRWLTCLLGMLLAVPVDAGVISVAPTEQIDGVIGLSYRFRVEEQSGRQYGKILFIAHSLYNPDNCTGTWCPQHQIEALISNTTHAPQIGDCCWDGQGAAPQPPVCANYNAPPFSGLKIGAWIGDKHAPSGLWMSDSPLWPRRALGVDSSLTDFKLEATYQRDITGVDGRIAWRRGDLLPAGDTRPWGRACLPMTLDRPMRQWHVTVDLGSEHVDGTAIYPENEAAFLRPDRTLEFVTEFFEFPGTVRIFVWDIAAETQEGQSFLRDFQIVTRHPHVPIGYWGVRVTQYQGHDVLEFGTAPDVTYSSEPGTLLHLAAPPTSIPTVANSGLLVLIAVFLITLLVVIMHQHQHHDDGNREQ